MVSGSSLTVHLFFTETEQLLGDMWVSVLTHCLELGIEETDL